MRAMYIAVPAGFALACAGGALMVASKTSKPASYGTDPFLLPGAVRHLVTAEMVSETAARTSKLLKTFRVADSEGKTVVLGSHDAAHPQFVYFILDGCPCSYDAEPLFHKLFKRFRDHIDFAAVTDGDRKKAHDWSIQLLVNYPIVPDPAKEIIHAYGARASVYSALIGRDGHVIKMWPGYSAGLLQDMNATMARAAGLPAQPFDTEYAPKVKATGCAF